jgi:O-antigen ligase
MIATVSWGVLAFGAVYPWAYWPLFWGALIVGLLGLRVGAGIRVTLREPLSLALIAVSCAMLLQLVPLTPSILGTVSPATVAFIQDYMPPPVAGPAPDGFPAPESARRSQPISLRPRATVVALSATLALGLMVVGGASGLGVTGARRIAAALLILGVIVAVMAMVQGPAFRGRIYGLWEPLHANTATGPFVNRNHFAGWMVMAMSAGLGYFVAIASRPARRLYGWRSHLLWWFSPEASGIVLAGLALGVMGLALGQTASRSGAVCFVVALLVLGTAAIRNRLRAGTPQPQPKLMMASMVFLGFVTLVWASLPAIASRFPSDSERSPFAVGGRAALWNDALQVVRRFPLTGTGLNTYTVVSPFYQDGLTPTADQAHNDYLQLAAEGGLLVGIPILCLVAVFAREVRRRFRAGGQRLTSYWLRAGAVAGLLAIAVQESVDFSLQLPGNAVMFAALCAVAVHRPEGSGR